jgi:hypothetical protein
MDLLLLEIIVPAFGEKTVKARGISNILVSMKEKMGKEGCDENIAG